MLHNLLLVAALFASGPDDFPERGWKTTNAPAEGIVKLQYFAGDANHGDVYATCRPSEGFVHFSAVAEADTQEVEKIRVGSVSASAPAKSDPGPLGDYTTIVIPAGHRIFQAMVPGSTVEFAGVSYPVSSDSDQAAIRRFIGLCN